MSKVVINRANLYHNLDFFVDKLGCVDKLCVGLKDNAYGHGATTIAKLCQDYGISKVFVRNQKEAKKIENLNFDFVHILSGKATPTPKDNQHFTINCLDDIAKMPPKTKVQLKIDTSMHRNGIEVCDTYQAINAINSHNLILTGVFSHFCCADENNDKTKLQEKIFLKTIKSIKHKTKFEIHIANTNAVSRVDNTIYDHARVGIGIYGYSDIERYQKQLKPVMSLVAFKNSTRTICKNDTVGYGSCSFVCPVNNFVVSNYDIGYADGFLRINENQTYHTTNGKRVLGRVSMDNLSVQGDSDTVVLFDDVRVLAKLHNTITYDILVKISPNLPRVVV